MIENLFGFRPIVASFAQQLLDQISQIRFQQVQIEGLSVHDIFSDLSLFLMR